MLYAVSIWRGVTGVLSFECGNVMIWDMDSVTAESAGK